MSTLARSPDTPYLGFAWWDHGVGIESFPHRLRVFVAHTFREARVCSPEEALCLLANALMRAVDERVQAELERAGSDLHELYAQMSAVEQEHGLRDGQIWRIDEAPAEYQLLNRRWQHVVWQMTFEAFLASGEIELAELYRYDPEEFAQCIALGRERLERRWGTRALNEWLQ